MYSLYKHLPFIRIVISILALGSCSNNKDPLTCFKEEIYVTPIELPIQGIEKVLSPHLIYLVNNYLIAFDFKGDNFFGLIDLPARKYIKHFGIKGKGPNEFMSPFSINSYGNDIEIFDLILNSLLHFSIDSIARNTLNYHKIDFQTDIRFHRIVRVKYNQFVATGNFEQKYLLLNRNGEIIKYKYEYPDDQTNNPGPIKSMAYQGKLVVSPDSSKILYANYSSAIFEISRIEKGDIVKIKDSYITFPKYTPDKKVKGYSVIHDRNNPFGFIDACTSNKHIFLLYSGKSHKNYKQDAFTGEQILVYDWEGNPQYKMKLDRSIVSISTDSTENVIYGLSVDERARILEIKL
jgi:hypothetical protein